MNPCSAWEKDEPIRRFLTKVPSGRFEPSNGPGTLAGLAVEVDDDTGLARAVAPLRLGGVLEETVPGFWSE
jgi:calcineurin-like phosphoesterase